MKTFIIQKLILVVIMAAVSCKHKNPANVNDKIIVDTIDLSKEEYPLKNAGHADTVQINYQLNQDILNLIPLIPDTAMQSWGWSKADRNAFLSMVKKRNYFVDTNPQYNNIKDVRPHYFETQVVDGLFSVSCYKGSNGDFLLITNDQVGDGNYLCAYQVSSNRITEIKINEVIGSLDSYLKVHAAEEKCETQLEEAAPYSSYDLSTLNEISILVPLEKAKSEKCVDGNSIKLKFDAVTGKFNVDSISWFDAG
jgi:hypothetical protein